MGGRDDLTARSENGTGATPGGCVSALRDVISRACQMSPTGPPPMTDTLPPRILCIGMPVRDLTFRVEGVPARGAKIRASQYDELAGGNALNAAVGVARLGGRASFAGPTGHAGDASAAFIFAQLAKEGIEHSGVVHMPGVATPISAIMMDASGERTIVTFRDPALWDVVLPDADVLLADCAAVLVENRGASFVTALCTEARRRGIPVIVDADHAMSLSEGLLSASSHIVFSAEALAATAGTADAASALRRVAGLTGSFLGVTNGPNGTNWLDGDGALRHSPAFPVHTVDTLGAGDIFHGAFALAIAEGMSIEDAIRLSSAAAALKCTRFGGAFAAPDRAEVDAFLAAFPR
jgi:sugar/nucleoside kinase (ribokinase family)